MLSARLEELLFKDPGGPVLCGLTYGQPLATAPFPGWMDAAHWGKVELGEEEVRKLTCDARPNGKGDCIQTIWVTLDLAGYAPPKALFKALCAAVSGRVGNKGSSQGGLWRIWWFDGPPRGSVALHHDQSRLHLVVGPRAGERLDELG